MSGKTDYRRDAEAQRIEETEEETEEEAFEGDYWIKGLHGLRRS
jgi:hypothetical protein